jgi:hypothetical protein
VLVEFLERTVFKYVFNHISGHKNIHKLQSGFLTGYSTSHQLVEIYHCIMTAFENQTPLTLTFCDVSKVFDHVWIRGLIYKLISVTYYPLWFMMLPTTLFETEIPEHLTFLKLTLKVKLYWLKFRLIS